MGSVFARNTRKHQVKAIQKKPTPIDIFEMLKAMGRADIAEIRQLLKKGVSPEYRYKGHSFMSMAVASGEAQIVKEFIAAGADVNASCLEGNVAKYMDVAFLQGDLALMRVLLEAGASHVKADIEDNYLFNALYTERYDIIELLVEFGANFMELSPDGQETVLSILHKQGQMDVIRRMAQVAPNVNLVDAMNITLLKYSAISGEYEIARILLERGADTEIANHLYRETPLFIAVRNDDAEMVTLFVEAGASTKRKNVDGQTPLELAFSCGSASAALILWQHFGLSPLDEYKGATLQKHFKNKKGEELIKQWCVSRQAAQDLLIAFGTDGTQRSSGLNQAGQRRKGLAL